MPKRETEVSVFVLVSGELARTIADSGEWSPPVQIKIVRHEPRGWEMLLREPAATEDGGSAPTNSAPDPDMRVWSDPA